MVCSYEHTLNTFFLMSISPFGHKAVGNLSGVRAMYSPQPHSPVLEASANQLRQGPVVPVDEFLKVLRNTKGVKEHRSILVKSVKDNLERW